MCVPKVAGFQFGDVARAASLSVLPGGGPDKTFQASTAGINGRRNGEKVGAFSGAIGRLPAEWLFSISPPLNFLLLNDLHHKEIRLRSTST